MKLKFKKQGYQTDAVDGIVQCFSGQPHGEGHRYRMDMGKMDLPMEIAGFKNDDIKIGPDAILENIQKQQSSQKIHRSEKLVGTQNCGINLDVEMETGTGKTYCYIKTMFELNRQYGWNKYIVVVPSIAIREGVHKSFEITAEHFLEEYGKKAKFFVYNSKQLYNLDTFSTDTGINVMIINIQAFNARGKDNRKIYEELDDFQSRKPIDVIKANRPILILDEPQKMEGEKTKKALANFDPLFILRYSATHKTRHNPVYRLDALDAFEQKLVKKIAVRGITTKGLKGTDAYLYLERIDTSPDAPPVATMGLEIKQKSGIKRVFRKIHGGDNLYDISKGLDSYKGFTVSEINARDGMVEFSNGHKALLGEATGNPEDAFLRRIQIREALKAHFDKERILFRKGIKTLSLFFIDEVAKYRTYPEGEGAKWEKGEYALIFEEEYRALSGELMEQMGKNEEGYARYLKNISAEKTHHGYFSMDKKKKMIDSKETGRGEERQCQDADAYDLILKDKERLLSFEEPVRFIFSHSALREGWDNPNVFVICALKQSNNIVSRRQEVGRGMRLCVDKHGERQDDPVSVHQTNVLTVVANESYKDFVAGLQKDISDNVTSRPRKANADFFRNKIIGDGDKKIPIDGQMADKIFHYLAKNDYVDDDDHITSEYCDAVGEDTLKEFPESLQPHKEEILKLIGTLYSDAKLPEIEDERKLTKNSPNDNFDKKEFQELWSKINKKSFYEINFKTEELTQKCIEALNKIKVIPLQVVVERGEQEEAISQEDIAKGEGFKKPGSITVTSMEGGSTQLKYDLLVKVMEGVNLSRKTVGRIMGDLDKSATGQFSLNPEEFIAKATTLINEEKAASIIEHLTYDLTSETYSVDIFTENQVPGFSDKIKGPLKKHIYDYCLTDSKTEGDFVEELDAGEQVSVYAKLPRGFSIPTPVGNYNPDWAISFKKGTVKHIYFVAETKGSLSSMQLRKIEDDKRKSAEKFFERINVGFGDDKVKYSVVTSYGDLMDMVS